MGGSLAQLSLSRPLIAHKTLPTESNLFLKKSVWISVYTNFSWYGFLRTLMFSPLELEAQDQPSLDSV